MSAIDRAIEALEKTRAQLGEGFQDAFGTGKIAGMSEAINYLRALPSIGEEPAREEVTLEWETSGQRTYAVSAPWLIIEKEGAFGIFVVAYQAIVGEEVFLPHEWVKSLDEAKQVCQRLQNVLDGAPVGQVLTRDTPEGESDECHDSLIRMHDRCPTCGFPLEEGAKVCVTPN